MRQKQDSAPPLSLRTTLKVCEITRSPADACMWGGQLLYRPFFKNTLRDEEPLRVKKRNHGMRALDSYGASGAEGADPPAALEAEAAAEASAAIPPPAAPPTPPAATKGAAPSPGAPATPKMTRLIICALWQRHISLASVELQG